MVKAKKWVLKQHFVGEPKDEDLQMEEEELPEMKDGDVMFEAVCWSVDPYMRPYSTKLSPPVDMIGQQLARVVETKNGSYPLGSRYLCDFGWRNLYVVNPDKVDVANFDGKPPIIPAPDCQGLPESLLLGALGMPGATAYFGLMNVLEIKAGDTVLVSGAAGAVGSVVGQIAKIKGCKVIGYAGSDEKVAWLKELGFDYAFNYKTCDLNATLKEAAPKGIDRYFDNVGGKFSSTVVSGHMSMGGRIACCGAISAYNATSMPQGPELFGTFIFNRLRMRGFIVYEFFNDYAKAIGELVQWTKEGKLKAREHVTKGFENMRAAFYGMMKGENTGKAVIMA